MYEIITYNKNLRNTFAIKRNAIKLKRFFHTIDKRRGN